MTLSILNNTTIAFDMEATSDHGGTWAAVGSASAVALDGDVFKVGTGAINAKLDGGASGAKGGMAITTTTQHDFDDAGTRRGMVAFWALTTSVLRDTATTGGITLRVGSDVSNYFEWQVATGDGSAGLTYAGGWVRMVVDLNVAPDTIVGTPVMSAADYFEINFDVSTDIMGNIKTIWIDQMDILTAADIVAGTKAFEVRGTTVTAGSALSELAALATVTDLGAIVQSSNGSFDLNMPVKFGDTTAATTSTITSTNEYLFIPPHRFGSGFCVIEFDGGTGTNTATWGAESGTGDNTLGATGGAIRGIQDGTNGNFAIVMDATDSTNVFAGVIIDGANNVSLTGTNSKWVSCTLVNSGSLTLDSGGEFRDGTISDSIAASGVGAVIFAGQPTDPEFRDNLVQNCIHGLENEVNGPISWDLRNIKFANNTADIRFNHASGLLTVNVLEGGDTPTTSDGGAGGTITVVAAVTLTITVKSASTGGTIEGVTIFIDEDPVSIPPTISQGTTNSSGVFSDSFSGATPQNVTVRARLRGLIPVTVLSTIVSNTGLNVPITMTEDAGADRV